jgi:adenylate cyclase
MTVAEAAERSGVTVERLRGLLRVTGLADPDPGARVVTEAFVQLASSTDLVADFFGEEAMFQILRVMGGAMARVADALVSVFLVHVEPQARERNPYGLEVARANVEAGRLLPLVAPVMDALLRQHLLVAQRSATVETGVVGYETRELLVGFVDLVGSTELGERVGLRELGDVLTLFEQLATDAVTAGGGRVVKLIGDEVLFTAPDARAGVEIALDLSSALQGQPTLPPVRTGLAFGKVIVREGDVFGPAVNLASRVVDEASPSEVLATSEVAELAGWTSEPAGHHRIRGVGGEVELRRLTAG